MNFRERHIHIRMTSPMEVIIRGNKKVSKKVNLFTISIQKTLPFTKVSLDANPLTQGGSKTKLL